MINKIKTINKKNSISQIFSIRMFTKKSYNIHYFINKK